MSRVRRTLRPLAAAGALAAVVLLAPGLLALTVAIAGGVLLALGLLALVGARALKRATAQVLEEQPHLNRLGSDFEHHFDGARVLSVDRDDQGRVHLALRWEDQQTVHLDADGMPDAVSHSGPGAIDWVLPGDDLGPFELATLQELPEAEVTIVEQGTVVLSGEAVQRRRLVSSNGLDLNLHSSVLAL